MSKISIIIPVYNVEKYIKKCLESLARQTMQDFEIIIVNDGSKDGSGEIIKKYKKENNNLKIKYYEKENGGLASARNYGVQYAEGKYISFLDPDDYLDKDLYKNLEQYMDENIDIIKFKMKMVDEKANIIENLDGPVFEVCTGEEAYKKLCTDDKYLDPACIYLYRREYFTKNNFEYRLRYHEDFGLTSLILIQAKTVVSTKYFGYYYLQTQNSLTRGQDEEKNILRAKDLLDHYDHMMELIDIYQITEETKQAVKRYYTNSIVLKAETLKGKDFKEYVKELKQRKVYKNITPENTKQKIKRLLLKLNIRLYLKVR